MSHPCAVAGCKNPTEAVICNRCYRLTEIHLGDMPAHAAELTLAKTRQTRFLPLADGPRSTGETPVPWQEQAGRMMDDLRSILVGWCRLLHEDFSVPLPDRDTITAMSRTLLAHIEDLAKHEAVGEFADEVSDACRRIALVIDVPEDRARVTIGPCPQVLDAEAEDGMIVREPCPGQLVEHLPSDPRSRKAWIECPACGTVWDATMALQTMADGPVRLSVGDICELTDIPRTTITTWVSEGKLTRYGPERSYLLDLAEVKALREQTRKRSAA